MRPSEVFRADMLADQVVIVTGGGSGIGRAIAEECAALGARLALGAREEDRLARTADELRAQGVDVFAAPLNIRDSDACEEWIAAAHAHHGTLDALVNNAGGQFPSAAEHISTKGWKAVIDTNLSGTWFMSRAFARQQFADQRPGRIVSIVAAMWRGFPGMAHSGAARAGVVNLTKSLSLEWASRGILVNAVAPGVIRSTGLDSYPPAVKQMLESTVPQQIPLRRLGEVADTVWPVVYLLGPGGRYVTGETFCVDGGLALSGTLFPFG
jgi:citronellol/citronellal dehydrogenase